jgi:ketosteroid isomerase-like protein
MPTADDAATGELLRALSEGYVQGVDRRDVATFLAVFHPDAVITVHDPRESDEPLQIRGAERLAKIPKMLKGYAKTCHMLGQSTYDIGDGEATGEVSCIAHHLSRDPHGGTDYVMYIRYEDTYRPDEAGVWKFAERRLRVDWTETRAANPPRP